MSAPTRTSLPSPSSSLPLLSAPSLNVPPCSHLFPFAPVCPGMRSSQEGCLCARLPCRGDWQRVEG
eukprot:163033-Rhodomonas_salina.1